MTTRSSLQRLRRAVRRGEAALGRFFQKQRFPMVDETTVLFVFRGAADRVRLEHWIYGLPASIDFHRLDLCEELWYLEIELPEKSRVEYKLNVSRGGTSEWILDSLNPNHAHDPFGSNSVCHGEGYEVPEWAIEKPGVRAGTIEEWVVPSRSLRRQLPTLIYLPARFRETRKYPLLIVHDGRDYLRFAALRAVLDNLIDRLEIPQLVVALTQSSDRLNEYAASRAHARFISTELVDFIGDRVPLDPSPQARGLLGASFGAVAGLHAAWRYPGQFGKLLLQSGSFVFNDIGKQQRGPEFESVARFVNSYRNDPIAFSSRLFMSCGMYEPLIYENRSLVPILHQSGMEVRYSEARDGHNWENWRDRLREGLTWLFPGPLWMTYE